MSFESLIKGAEEEEPADSVGAATGETEDAAAEQRLQELRTQIHAAWQELPGAVARVRDRLRNSSTPFDAAFLDCQYQLDPDAQPPDTQPARRASFGEHSLAHGRRLIQIAKARSFVQQHTVDAWDTGKDLYQHTAGVYASDHPHAGLTFDRQYAYPLYLGDDGILYYPLRRRDRLETTVFDQPSEYGFYDPSRPWPERAVPSVEDLPRYYDSILQGLVHLLDVHNLE